MAATKTLLSRSGRLWFAVLTGPVLWVVELYVNYQWEEVLACSPATRDLGAVLGIGVRTWILLVNTVATAGTLAALAVALRCYRRTRGEVAHWMAFAGVVNSVLFLFLIVVGYAPALMLRPCQLPL
jgi:hypothetical protein